MRFEEANLVTILVLLFYKNINFKNLRLVDCILLIIVCFMLVLYDEKISFDLVVGGNFDADS